MSTSIANLKNTAEPIKIAEKTNTVAEKKLTAQDLTKFGQSLETKTLSKKMFHTEAKKIESIFDKNLSYDQLSWLEQKFIRRETYIKGMNLFFTNLKNDINQGSLRTYDEAVTAATQAIAKKPSEGDRVKQKMLTKIKNTIPEFKSRYQRLREQVNNPESNAV